MKTNLRTSKYLEIIFDYSYSEKKTEVAIVLLHGLPYAPKEYDIISMFNQRNYDVYIPHYAGTWGSEGVFLNKNPVSSINIFLEKLKGGLPIDKEKKVFYKSVIVIGTSFGGGLALTLQDQNFLQFVIALSPVISYKDIKNITTLATHLKKHYSGSFNFKNESILLLANDKIIYPPNQYLLSSKKVLVFLGKKDSQIPPKSIEDFCKSKKIKYYTENKDHITFSKIDKDIFEKIINFVENK